MSVKLEILIYRYNQASLMRRIRKYNELLSKDVAKAVQADTILIDFY